MDLSIDAALIAIVAVAFVAYTNNNIGVIIKYIVVVEVDLV